MKDDYLKALRYEEKDTLELIAHLHKKSMKVEGAKRVSLELKIDRYHGYLAGIRFSISQYLQFEINNYS